MRSGKYPNQDEMCYGIVVGGDSEDPAPDQAGGFRVWCPSQYGPNVPIDHLPFSRMLAEGTQDGMGRFNPPPERGSAVMVMKSSGHSGTGHLTVLGVLPNDVAKGQGVSGGKSLNQGAIQDAIDHETDKKAPPENLKDDERDGAKIRKVEDKKMWAHKLVKNIPSTATSWPMSGIQLPSVDNVHTAIQHFTGIMNQQMAGQMPGSNMSLGSMFSSMMQNGMMDKIKEKVDPQVAGAMESMANLIPSIEMGEGAGFTVGGGQRVHEETFLENALELLSQARNITDICDVLQRLQWDKELFGQDKLEDIIITTDTPFGSLELTLTFDGTITPNVNIANVIATANSSNANTASSSSSSDNENDFAKNIQSFINLMQSAEQAFAMSGKNMFGESAKQKFDMYNRMNPGALEASKKMIETLTKGQKESQHHREVAKLVRDGGKLLSGKGFKQ